MCYLFFLSKQKTIVVNNVFKGHKTNTFGSSSQIKKLFNIKIYVVEYHIVFGIGNSSRDK